MKQLSILAAALAIAAGQSYIGRVDTIGGTTYDWWVSANVHRSLVNSPQCGIHAVWTYSVSDTGFPDRNVRYNFYDYATRQWNWPDPDHMQSGVNVFGERTGYGVIDADSAGRASVAANANSGLVIARDAGPGYGIFDFSATLPGYYWPDMVIGDDGTYHVAMSSQNYTLSYGRIRPGHDWDSIRPLDSTAFPAYAIAAGKTEPFVCVTWVDTGHVFYVSSENRGDTWSSKTELEPPPAFGGDTITRFSPYGVFPFFDSQGRLHITAAVYPEVHDTAHTNPAEIWHWCPANQPSWARIHHAGCAPENMQGSIGYSAIYADRPSMGEGSDGQLYVAWEQFDSSNVEPTTGRLRAGIWVSRSQDNGADWEPGQLVTDRNTNSHRFPCIIDRMVAGDPSEDTICVLYLADQVAGFFVMGEGVATPNPVICQFIPSQLDAVAETKCIQVPSICKMTTIVGGVLWMPGFGTRSELPERNSVMSCAVLLDATGRKVMELHPGANDVRVLAPGVYFVRAASREPSAASCSKVMIVR
jgi:hypothetical protein